MLILWALESTDISSAHRSTARAGSIQRMSSEHYSSFCVASDWYLCHMSVMAVCPFQKFAYICVQLQDGRGVHGTLPAGTGHLWELVTQTWTTPQNQPRETTGSSRRSRADVQLCICMLWATKITDGQQSFVRNALLYFHGILKIAQRESTLSNKHIAII